MILVSISTSLAAPFIFYDNNIFIKMNVSGR